MNQAARAAPPSLAHLPLPLLTIPMGLGGLGLAWRQASISLGVPEAIGEGVLALTALAWILLVGLHGMRALRHPTALAAELRHPVRAPFMATPTIGLMLLGGGAWPYAPGLGAALWSAGVVLHLLVAMALLRRVVAGGGEAAMVTPPLLIPFVGNIVAPALGAAMGFVEASWMMAGIGLLLWLMIMPLLLHRLLAGPPLPAPLRPSLAILLAPPSVGALAVMQLTGSAGGVTLAFAGLAFLVAAVLVSTAEEFSRLPFSLTWWSFTFPSAAFAVMVMATGFPPALGWFALAVSTGVTGWTAWRTVLAARAGAFLRPEG